ncbi:DNA-processing protein DprA [Methanobrevibacter sp.]|uniref:DNA-processing protein DprA n=1 Tax=Methanobrevibacter sp. TaxID=66852 RepID=UPI0026E0FE68|nr:DNA-processing protein DprA [Methanobrevibacter sp.]MDO5859859.1 DNA-processing protein DprA [Methanobrevibacter sp.]
MINKFKELLFLKNIKGLGNAKINKNYLGLLDEYSDLDDLITEIEYRFKISLENLENAKVKAEKLYDEITDDPEIHIITVFDENYPKKLEVMGNKKPLILYVKGNVDALSKPNIAVIGTRKPSALSQEFETGLVQNIVNKTDKVVVSGLALGCDKIAHQTTVDENKITVAVLPSGVNVIKPAKHKQLAQKIIETGGCLVSEYEPHVGVNRGSYVERDAIVAAFSDATFVVECGIKSGTMHTVDFANDYKRQLFAYLPENRPEKSYEGNEFILRNNKDAIKVEDINEFLDNLESLKPKKKSASVQVSLF